MAVEWRKLQNNPIRQVKPFKEPKNSERFLNEEEARRLLAACSSSLRPIVLTALQTGMSKQEILSLTWDRVNLNDRSFKLVDTKNGEPRDVPLNATIVTLLESLPRIGEYVFTNSRGQRYHCVNRDIAHKKGSQDYLRAFPL